MKANKLAGAVNQFYAADLTEMSRRALEKLIIIS